MTGKSSNTQATSKVILEPINLHDKLQFDELLRQRVICGWNDTTSIIEDWRHEVDAGTRAIFWIIPGAYSHLYQLEKWVGHIAILNQVSPPDLELARPDKSVLHIASLFILPEYRSGGIGRAAVKALERSAKSEPYGSPCCKWITIHTLSRRYIEDDGEEWRGIWPKLGQPAPERGTGTENWYLRMGYVKWKEEPMYKDNCLDGTGVTLVASFLRKTLTN